MFEHFPQKKTGDRLEAAHVNRINDVCKRLTSGFGGSNANHFFGGSVNGVIANAPFFLWPLIILEDLGEGLYKIGLRTYDHDTGEWTTTTEQGSASPLEFGAQLDASESGNTFSVDDKLQAYWNPQRGAFMPLGGAIGPILKIGTTREAIEPNHKGTVVLYERPADLPETEEDEGDEGNPPIEVDPEQLQEDVWHDWITGATEIPAGTEVVIGYFAEERLWRIIGAEC